MSEAKRISSRINGAIGGRRTKETRVGIFDPAYDRTEHARAMGLQNVEKHRGIFAPDFDKTMPGRVGGSLGGKISGERHRRNKTGICAQTHADHVACGKVGGPRSAHLRWHVRRGLFSDRCSICMGEENLNEGRKP